MDEYRFYLSKPNGIGDGLLEDYLANSARKKVSREDLKKQILVAAEVQKIGYDEENCWGYFNVYADSRKEAESRINAFVESLEKILGTKIKGLNMPEFETSQKSSDN